MRRFGLIGFGSIAEHGHLPALQSFPDVEVVAVADLSPERLARAAAIVPHAEMYDSPVELIDRADVTGVDVCTPPSTHADLIVAACRRGLADVVSEKPFVLSEEEFQRVAHARSESGSRVISVNNWLASDLNRHVRALQNEDAIGAIRHVELHTGRPDVAQGNAGWLPRWRTDPSHSGGGIILDHGWHQLYLVVGWMRSAVQSVKATTRVADQSHFPVEDEATIDIEFAQGTARLELSWTASGRSNDGFIRGDHGEVTIHDDRVVVRTDKGVRDLPFNSRLTMSSYHPEWFEQMFRYNVLDENHREADRNFREAGALVSIIGTAYRSAREGGTLLRPAIPGEVTAGV
jgi:predicted dehydrogenase